MKSATQAELQDDFDRLLCQVVVPVDVVLESGKVVRHYVTEEQLERLHRLIDGMKKKGRKRA